MKNKLTLLLTVLITLGITSCKDEAKKSNEIADTVFTNGKIYTVDESNPWAEAVAIKDDKIVFVGASEDAQSYIGDATEKTDLGGKLMLPGFVSAHDHLITSGWLNLELNLYGATSKQETLDIVKKYADENPDEAVILGIGWSPQILGGLPTKADLDAIVSDRPVLLVEANTHEAWFNTKALTDAKIPEDAPNRQDGVTYWVRDDNGKMTGVGYEFQWLDIYIALGLWDLEEMVPPIQKSVSQLTSSNGITTLLATGIFLPSTLTQDGQYEEIEKVMAYLAELEAKDELDMRVSGAPTLKGATTNVVEMADWTKKMADKYNSDNLNIRGVKIHPEAGLVTKNAPFLNPYEGETTKGNFGVSPERTMEMTLEANKRGLDTYVHVEGNASVRAAIDAFEASIKAGNSNRNSLHHLAFVTPEDYQRIIDLDLLVNATPQFTTSMGGQDKYLVEFLGQNRVDEQLGRYTDLAHDGVKVSISSDFPGTPADMVSPIFNMQVAMTLINPADPESQPFPDVRKRLTLEQAIKAVTIDAALFMQMEDKVGSIEVGKYADLVVVDQNIFETDVNDFKNVKVLSTIMGGKYRYKAE